ncbi:hypothetical protein EYF80_060905 [Liparis tanakae]|uniref:Uncharacterized protein n=1 Tax=Liparis tanakae TaxID=230148 RepID=A0A4Z2EJA0_9TELE|nr:hypothetical protein EYF80_060905 [Liparis tanakae]
MVKVTELSEPTGRRLNPTICFLLPASCFLLPAFCFLLHSREPAVSREMEKHSEPTAVYQDASSMFDEER